MKEKRELRQSRHHWMEQVRKNVLQQGRDWCEVPDFEIQERGFYAAGDPCNTDTT
jgi:hypothetical protein